MKWVRLGKGGPGNLSKLEMFDKSSCVLEQYSKKEFLYVKADYGKMWVLISIQKRKVSFWRKGQQDASIIS